jgi:hypothetical protein
MHRWALFVVCSFAATELALAWLLRLSNTTWSAPWTGCRGNATARWVLAAHMSGDGRRAGAVQSTWLRPSQNVGVLAFGPGGGSDWEKTRGAFRQALRCFPQAEWIAKFDDDSYVYAQRLFERLHTGDYVGYPVKIKGLNYAQGGAGIILSRRAAHLLLRCSPDIRVKRWEDISVGWCMQRLGVPLTDLPGLFHGTPDEKRVWSPRFSVRSESLSTHLHPLSFHNLKPEEVLRLHLNRRRNPLLPARKFK